MSNIETLSNPQANDVNGQFLAHIEAEGATHSRMTDAVKAVAHEYIDEGGLAFALGHIKEQGTDQLSDHWENNALTGLENGQEATGFNDAISGGEPRTAEKYMGRVVVGEANPLNENARFPGMRPDGFEIQAEQQPVMALVALDPAMLKADVDKPTLIEEIKELRKQATDSNSIVRDKAVKEMSPELRGVLSDCLITNDTYVDAKNAEGESEKWNMPFDFIASLKALYTVLDGAEHSGEMRQGAVRAKNAEGQEIVVGGSGLNPALDEMVARNFANEVLAQPTNQ